MADWLEPNMSVIILVDLFEFLDLLQTCITCFHTYIVYCYAPAYQDKFLENLNSENLLSNKSDSDYCFLMYSLTTKYHVCYSSTCMLFCIGSTQFVVIRFHNCIILPNYIPGHWTNNYIVYCTFMKQREDTTMFSTLLFSWRKKTD